MIGQIAEELRSQYNNPPDKAEGSQQASTISPTSYLWTLYFLAQHYSYLKDYQRALTVINSAIEHTPTLPELHSCKARLLKRAGDPLGAVRAIEQARKLDLQDRFLNTKSAKYHLRANLSEEAQALLGLFTKVRYFFQKTSGPRSSSLLMSLPTTERCTFARCRPNRYAIHSLPNRGGRLSKETRKAWTGSHEIYRNPKSKFIIQFLTVSRVFIPKPIGI